MTQKLHLLATRLLLSLLALFTVSTAWADDVNVTSETNKWTGDNTYVVNSNVTISDRITVNGTVTLLLCDGYTLTASKGIEVGSGATLTINGESQNTGKLISTGTSENAGIGAYEVGTIIINGGTIQATGGYRGAGIGGSIHGGSDGTITINGGIVTATGGEGAAGIGGGEGASWGDAYGKCGTITINGGQVTATGGKDAPGIGPGYDGDDNTSGSLTLGWTNATDFISVTGQSNGNYCGFSNRLGSISFKEEDSFLIAGVGVATTENIKDKASVRLVPSSDDVKKNLSNASITGINPVYHYTGSDISVQYTVKDAAGTTLTKDTDYEVAITLNGVTATAVNAVGDYTLTFTGKGGYTGFQTVNFEVTECPEGLSIDDSFNKSEAGYYYVNMPAIGSNTVTLTTASVTTFKVYDDGGKSEWYSNNCWGTLTLTAPEGYLLQLSGSIITESGCDKLTVYNGSNYSGKKLLDAVSSTCDEIETTITTVVSTGRSMTLYFESNDTYETDGLNLTVTLVDATSKFNLTVNSVTGGSVAATIDGASVSTVKVNDVVTLTATPSEGYVLCDLSVKDGNGNDVAVTDMLWYTDMNTATFTMPASAATVTPIFTSTLTADGGLYINLPKSGTKTVTIPTGVQSFKVYDDGGANGKYSYNCNGTLTLTAPNCVLQLSGSIITETYNDDYLTVYDGSNASFGTLLNKVCSPSDGTETPITTVSSTGQSMTLYFYSDEWENYDGLNLTVTLVKIMELADNADNTLAINGWQNGLANVTLKNRTLYKDGKWNTLCLPFDVTIAGSPLDGATARTVTEASISDATLNLTFGGEVTELVAGTPYIIKWDKAADYVDNDAHNIVSPVFNGVTITAAEPRLYDNQAADDLRVRFVGTYKSTEFGSQDKSILLMGAGNTLYYPAAGAGVGSFRAYFKIGSDGALQAPRLTSFNINFDDDDSTTGIIDGLSPAFSQGEGAWYSIDGRKLDGQPTQHGIYINNGKKVVIK